VINTDHTDVANRAKSVIVSRSIDGSTNEVQKSVAGAMCLKKKPFLENDHCLP